MAWFKVDDSFGDHPKVKSIPRNERKGAVALWTLAGSYAARQLTEGFVFADDVLDLGCSSKDAAALVQSGLWHRHGHDCDRCPPVAGNQYLFHDWLIYQRPRAKVLAERAASTERQRKAREAARQERESQRDSGVTSPSVTAPPTRPDPTPVVKDLGGERPETLRAVSDSNAPKCSTHPNGDYDGPCGGCGKVRERNERGDARAAERAARAADELRRNCPVCGGDGKIPNPDGTPSSRRCDHSRKAEIA